MKPRVAGTARQRIEIGIAAAIAVAWTISLPFSPPKTAQWISDAGLMAVALLAGLRCLHTGFRSVGRSRRFWMLLGISAISWGLGQTVWDWYEAVLGKEVPFPGWSDLGYL